MQSTPKFHNILHRDRTAARDKRAQEGDDSRQTRARARRARRDSSGGGGGGVDSGGEGLLGGLQTPGALSRFEEDDDDGSDDEGDESSEASDLDDDGKVLLLPTDLVGPDGGDENVTFITPPSVNRPHSFAPVPSSGLEAVRRIYSKTNYTCEVWLACFWGVQVALDRTPTCRLLNF
jgi:hypothetical protein